MCDQCSGTFRDQTSLNKHLVKHHNCKIVKETSFICGICGRKCLSSNNFDRHMNACLAKQTKLLKQDNRRDDVEIKSKVHSIIKHEVVEEHLDDSSVDNCDTELMDFDESHESKNVIKGLNISPTSLLNHSEMAGESKIKCKVCSKIFNSCDDFKDHFASEHIKLHNVSFCFVKVEKLENFVVYETDDRDFNETVAQKDKDCDSPQASQSHSHLADSDHHDEEEEHLEDVKVDDIDELTDGEPENLDEDVLSQIFKGETFNNFARAFECKFCKRDFEVLTKLKLHCVKKHRVKKFKCKHCNHSFHDYKAIKNHWQHDHPDETFSKSFHNRKFANGIPNENVTCEQCGKVLVRKESLKRHILLVHTIEKPKLYCDKCGEMFLDIRPLRNHIKKYHAEKVLDLSDEPAKVIRRRKTTKKIKCDECGEEVFGQLNLSHHRWHKHIHIKLVGRSAFHCLICRQVLASRQTALRHHVEVHEEGKVLVRTCRVCSAEFKLYDDFKRHIEDNHVNEHVCLICGHGFESKAALHKHNFDHRTVPEDEKKISCDLCGYRAQQKVSIVSHMISHHGAKKREFSTTCEICGAYFNCYPSFAVHKMTHKDKIKCNFCDKTYKQGRDLRAHELTHTNPGGKLIRLRLDDTQFIQKNSLQ